MRTRTLSGRFFIGSLVVMLIPLTVASWYTSVLYKKNFTETTAAAEKKQASLIGADLAPLLAAGHYARVDSLCKKAGRDIGIRITVVLPSGRVVGDSEKRPGSMERHDARPEIIAALAGRDGLAVRESATLGRSMMYVALPLLQNDTVAAVVRTAVPLSSITTTLRMYYLRIFIVVIFSALCALLLSVLFGRRITGPVNELIRGAERFAKGEFSRKIDVPAIEEIKLLAVAFNSMADQLHERIRTITRQRNEQEAILASMTEGVVAVDADGRILSVNASAAGFFGIDGGRSVGRPLGEVVRNSAVQGFVEKVLASEEPVESDITLPPAAGGKNGSRDRFLQVHGTRLKSGSNAVIGALLVASDVTRLRRLETVRREFVANVSHELRTPLTTIKGFVETLQSGALEKKEEAARFVGIMAEQVNRLNTLLEDLLSLAVIERDEEAKTLVMERHSLLETAKGAVREYELTAASKGMELAVRGDAGCFADINRPLMEQAVGNLVDNAIKYSGPQRTVTVEVSRRGQEAVIAVRDEGIGIAPEHLDRIFERFYRVDKARSRKLGGTGLGLSIVRHIAVMHKGTVLVESAAGGGSTFSVVLPLKRG